MYDEYTTYELWINECVQLLIILLQYGVDYQKRRMPKKKNKNRTTDM